MDFDSILPRRRLMLLSTACAAGILVNPKRAFASVPHEVLAFYYGWYGNPSKSHKWVHWNPAKDGRSATNITDQPQDGLYDSHDPAEVSRQMQEAREAGLTGLIASWWGPGDFTDQGLPLLLNAAGAQGLKVTAYIENITGQTNVEKKQNVITQLTYILANYANHPSWLRVKQQPVVFLYARATNELPPSEWIDVLKQVRGRSTNGLIVIGPSYSPPAFNIFDGCATYNVTGLTHGLSATEAGKKVHGFAQAVNEAMRAGKISCVTIIPGFNNRKGDVTTDRQNAAVYQALWSNAISLNPDWIVITSFNEWHEGSEIEPSKQYGGTYLAATKRFSAQFLGRSAPR